MKTNRVGRAIRTGMKSAGDVPHRSALRVPMARDAFNAHVAPLAREWSFRSVVWRRGGAEVTVKVFDAEGIHYSARTLRRALVAVSRATRVAVRFSSAL